MPRGRPAVVRSTDNEDEVQDQVTEALQFGQEAILQLAKDILPHCDRKTQQDVTSRLTQAYKKLIRAGIVYNNCNVIVKEVAKGIEVDNDANQATILQACDDIDVHSREKVTDFGDKITDDQICNDRLYIKLTDTLGEVLEDSSHPSSFDPQSDEIETDECGDESEVDVDDEATLAIVTKDPLTKKDIKNPVKNITCHHIYDEKTISNYIRTQKEKAKCPYAGCTNDDVLIKEHLVSDEQLVKKVSKKQKGQRRGRRR